MISAKFKENRSIIAGFAAALLALSLGAGTALARGGGGGGGHGGGGGYHGGGGYGGAASSGWTGGGAHTWGGYGGAATSGWTGQGGNPAYASAAANSWRYGNRGYGYGYGYGAGYYDDSWGNGQSWGAGAATGGPPPAQVNATVSAPLPEMKVQSYSWPDEKVTATKTTVKK